jgi:hypothetical protein
LLLVVLVVVLWLLGGLVYILNVSLPIKTTFLLGVTQTLLIPLGFSPVSMAPFTEERSRLFGIPSPLLVKILLPLGCALVTSTQSCLNLKNWEACLLPTLLVAFLNVL